MTEPHDDPVGALLAELLDTDALDKIPSLEPLVDDVLFLDTVARMNGESGAFKSFMALDLAASVGTGMDWHGRRTHQGPVIYLVAEGVKGIRKRVRAWEQHHGRKMTGVLFLPRPVLVRSTEWSVLIEACRRLRPALVVVDTQARVTVGVEENSATEMGVILHLVDQLRTSCEACVLLVHHSGLNATERGRGSTAIKGGMQTELNVSRTGKDLHSIRVHLKTSKQKDDEELTDIQFALQQIKLHGEAKPNGAPVTSVVLIPAAGAVIPGSVEDAIAKLDAAGIPLECGRDKARTEATKKGIVLPRNDVLGAAIKARRERRRPVPDARDGFIQQTCPQDQDSSDISAGQTCPGQVGDGAEQAESGPVPVSVSLETGRARTAPSGTCPHCHWPTDSQGHIERCGDDR